MWKFKGGSGIWKEYVNSETNESSIKEIKTKVIKRFCKNHHFEISSANKREITCTECGLVSNYILGFHEIIDGKLVEKKPPIKV